MQVHTNRQMLRSSGRIYGPRNSAVGDSGAVFDIAPFKFRVRTCEKAISLMSDAF